METSLNEVIKQNRYFNLLRVKGKEKQVLDCEGYDTLDEIHDSQKYLISNGYKRRGHWINPSEILEVTTWDTHKDPPLSIVEF